LTINFSLFFQLVVRPFESLICFSSHSLSLFDPHMFSKQRLNFNLCRSFVHSNTSNKFNRFISSSSYSSSNFRPSPSSKSHSHSPFFPSPFIRSLSSISTNPNIHTTMSNTPSTSPSSDSAPAKLLPTEFGFVPYDPVNFSLAHPEKEVLALWEKLDAFKKSVEISAKENRPLFTFNDG
jgi:hypothetical protein